VFHDFVTFASIVMLWFGFETTRELMNQPIDQNTIIIILAAIAGLIFLVFLIVMFVVIRKWVQSALMKNESSRKESP
jgi:divalent metal cation (Fe/Co/Zn/Cd) transporter